MGKGAKRGKKLRSDDPRRVPLGSGLAQNASMAIQGRERRIDDEIRSALSGRRRNQSTDSNQ